MHKILFFFLGEFGTDIPELLDADQEKDGFHVWLLAKPLHELFFQLPPPRLEVILGKHDAKLGISADGLSLRKF
jgi:hypothetical protein